MQAFPSEQVEPIQSAAKQEDFLTPAFYVIARKVGLVLYSRALLHTDMARFERSC